MTNSNLHDSLSVGTDAPRIAFRVLKRYLSSVPSDIHHYYRRHRADGIQDISTVNYRVIILKSAPQSIAVIVRAMKHKSPDKVIFMTIYQKINKLSLPSKKNFPVL